MSDTVFNDKKPDTGRLYAFGFAKIPGGYRCSRLIVDGQFELVVSITDDGQIHTDVTELASNEPYVLHQIPGACGEFVGTVRRAYEDVLAAIEEKCFVRDVFKSAYAQRVLDHIWQTYRDEPEYLWEKFPRNAVFRRKDNAKWYAALLVLPAKKLGLAHNGNIDIIDLRIRDKDVETLLDGKRYFPGYHMNKKRWFTMCLDGSVPLEEIFQWIASSYALAKKSR